MQVEKAAFDRYLAGLPMDQVADLLEQNLLYPDEIETAVFLWDNNVPRTAQAIEIVLARIVRRRKALNRKRGGDPRQARFLQRLEQIAGSERQKIRRRFTQIQSREDSAQPTARRRALARLSQQFPREYVQLVREEQATLENQRRAARQEVLEDVRRSMAAEADARGIPKPPG